MSSEVTAPGDCPDIALSFTTRYFLRERVFATSLRLPRASSFMQPYGTTSARFRQSSLAVFGSRLLAGLTCGTPATFMVRKTLISSNLR